MNFAAVEAVTLPEGNAVKLTEGSDVLWSAGGLPSEYQEVEYVQGNPISRTSGPYIDLGFAFDTAADIYISGHLYSMSGGQIFGAAENSGVYRCMITLSGTAYFYGSNGSEYLAIGFSGNAVGDFSYHYHLEPGKLTAENLLTGATSGYVTTNIAYTMTRNLFLFAQNYNTAARFAGGDAVNKFQYYDKNGDLICDLIPCYRKSDGEIGMYDLARKIFLTNAGSGNFIKGADVT